jgi:hypothetical protein
VVRAAFEAVRLVLSIVDAPFLIPTLTAISQTGSKWERRARRHDRAGRESREGLVRNSATVGGGQTVHGAPLNLHPLLHLQVGHFRVTPDAIVIRVRYGEAFIRARSVRSPTHAIADPGDSFRSLRAAGGR